MGGTYILMNHVQERFTGALTDGSDLTTKVNDYVDRMRPHVDGVIWAVDERNHDGKPFSIDREMPASYKPGDHVLTNNGGKGLDNGFLGKLNKIDPGRIIMGGTLYDACMGETACTIRQNLGVDLTVVQELSNKPDDAFDRKTHAKMTADLQAAGVTVKPAIADLPEGMRPPSSDGDRPGGPGASAQAQAPAAQVQPAQAHAEPPKAEAPARPPAADAAKPAKSAPPPTELRLETDNEARARIEAGRAPPPADPWSHERDQKPARPAQAAPARPEAAKPAAAKPAAAKPPEAPGGKTSGGGAGGKVMAGADRTVRHAQAATQALNGDVTGAATTVATDKAADAAQKLAGMGAEKAATATGGKWLLKAASKLPVIGGLLVAGQAMAEVGDLVRDGKYKEAAATAGARAAQAAATTVAGGVGGELVYTGTQQALQHGAGIKIQESDSMQLAKAAANAVSPKRAFNSAGKLPEHMRPENDGPAVAVHARPSASSTYGA
jgi:hypothetical protein